jgi:uncharacterized protein (TIGR00730 family)
VAERRPRYGTGHAELDDRIDELIDGAGLTRDHDLVFEMVVSAVRMGREATDRGDLKLVNSALKELRYTSFVFEPYREVRKVAVFGSARIRADQPAYTVARDFGARMAAQDWMVISGAGPGIMEAAIEGAGADAAFGVNIVLPFEAEPSHLLVGDPKLINYRYFFTRKLTFVKEASAFALLPGGFGTMDEAFELLTLMQTGRSPICPVVLLEPDGGTYWETWRSFVEQELLDRGLVDDHDLDLVRRCTGVDDAVDEITHFYSRYHSMRYVGRRLVIRLNSSIDDEALASLNDQFADIVTAGVIERVEASKSEIDDDDVPDLPRIALQFDRWHFARLRHLIDALNGTPPHLAQIETPPHLA